MKTKIVIFDFDGTLTLVEKGSSTWLKMWTEIDDLETDSYFFSLFESGKINHTQWFEMIVRHLSKRKISESVFVNVSKKLNLINEIENTFKFLFNNGVSIYILSSGIKNIIIHTLDYLKKYISSIEAYQFNIDENGLVVGGTSPNFINEEKNLFVQSLINENNLSPNDIIFFGNGANDECVSKTGVKTICLNGDDTDENDKKYWNASIRTNTLKDILQFID